MQANRLLLKKSALKLCTWRRMATPVPAYNRLQDVHVEQLQRLVGRSAITSDTEELKVACTDWTGQYQGSSRLLVSPSTSEQVQAVIKLCQDNNLPICIQAGNTSLVAGAVPIGEELILSTKRLNRIQQFDPSSGVLTCEAGCVLDLLDQHVGQHGYMMPTDLAARGSCLIGGNVATCAGGIHLIRYGPLYGHILGLEVVSPVDGCQRLDMLSTMRKDTSAFRLSNAFVGSEGQLGVITKVCLSVVPRPTTKHTAFLGCQTFADCVKMMQFIRIALGSILSSFEFVDSECIQCIEERLKLSYPMNTKCPFNILIETMGFDPDSDGRLTCAAVERCLANGFAVDGVLAESEQQSQDLWKLREYVTEAFHHDGYNYKYDLSLPTAVYYTLVEECRQRFAQHCHRIGGFGHLADGNLHLNISTQHPSDELRKNLDDFVYAWTIRNQGSISAEHGIGQLKLPFWSKASPKPVLQQCLALKSHFDPRWILNPGKTLHRLSS